MRDERIRFSCSFLKQSTRLESSLEEVRIVFVVDGECLVKSSERSILLKKKDFLLVNAMEEAQLSLSPSAYVTILSTPYFDLLRDTGKLSARFHLCSPEGSQGQYREISFMIQGLLMCFVGDIQEERLKAQGISCLILQNLISNFESTSVSGRQGQDETEKEKKTKLLLQYVWSNYRSELTITDIASKLYLSRSALSRMFKAATGENFPDYIRKLRLNAVRDELENTDNSITDIALGCGFSSPAVLNRTFKEAYGVSPKQYRAHRRTEAPDSLKDEQTRNQIREILWTDMQEGILNWEDVDIREVSLEDTVSFSHWKNRLLNVGHCYSLTSARLQEQILFLQERLNIEYLRIWNPFSSEMMIMRESPREFNYVFIDDILDFCVDHHFKLFIDLTPRRERNMASERREIVGKSSRVSFQSLEDWLFALESLIRHLRSRYQAETIREWIFELTFWLNDVPYYTGKDYSPRKLWEESFRTLKTLVPGIRIAGPGLISHGESSLDESALDEILKDRRYYPDIFTSMHFPYRIQGGKIYETGMEKIVSRSYFDQETGQIRELFRKKDFRGEYWVTECGISISNRNFLQDSCYRAVTMLETMLEYDDRIDAIGLFYASDLLGAFSDASSVLSGSGGILSRNGVRKPVYYAYRFIRQLGSIKLRLPATDHMIATMNHPGDIRILCWNRKNLGPKYFLMEEDSFGPDEIATLMEDSDPYVMELLIKGLEENQTYWIRQRIINQQTGNVLSRWIKLGGRASLSRDDMEYLVQTSVPEVQSEERIAAEGVIRIPIRMEVNEMRMIHIMKD